MTDWLEVRAGAGLNGYAGGLARWLAREDRLRANTVNRGARPVDKDGQLTCPQIAKPSHSNRRRRVQ